MKAEAWRVKGANDILLNVDVINADLTSKAKWPHNKTRDVVSGR